MGQGILDDVLVRFGAGLLVQLGPCMSTKETSRSDDHSRHSNHSMLERRAQLHVFQTFNKLFMNMDS